VTGGVPAEVISPLAEALGAVAVDPEVVKTFANLGIQSVGTAPQQATDSIQKDVPIYSQIVDMAGVRRK
jgi:tripartite-type tricarboxylate transporter receptor subunit TctC